MDAIQEAKQNLTDAIAQLAKASGVNAASVVPLVMAKRLSRKAYKVLRNTCKALGAPRTLPVGKKAKAAAAETAKADAKPDTRTLAQKNAEAIKRMAERRKAKLANLAKSRKK